MGLIETSSREWIKTAPLRNLSKFPAPVIYSQSHRLRKTYIPFITFLPSSPFSFEMLPLRDNVSQSNRIFRK